MVPEPGVIGVVRSTGSAAVKAGCRSRTADTQRGKDLRAGYSTMAVNGKPVCSVAVPEMLQPLAA